MRPKIVSRTSVIKAREGWIARPDHREVYQRVDEEANQPLGFHLVAAG